MNLLVAERAKDYHFSIGRNDASKLSCISRNDDKDKSIQVQENSRKGRWNLYSQIAIEDDKLKCAKEQYHLTDICKKVRNTQPCTLQDTNEVIDISYGSLTS